jgi:hypothetical protein
LGSTLFEVEKGGNISAVDAFSMHQFCNYMADLTELFSCQEIPYH